jgi:hypothetical protein
MYGTIPMPQDTLDTMTWCMVADEERRRALMCEAMDRAYRGLGGA